MSSIFSRFSFSYLRIALFFALLPLIGPSNVSSCFPRFPFLFVLISLSLPLPGTLPYDIKIVISGNHELTFDQEFMADLIKQDFYYFPSASKLKPENYENVQSLLTNCIYLQDSEVTVRGFKIYGAPW